MAFKTLPYNSAIRIKNIISHEKKKLEWGTKGNANLQRSHQNLKNYTFLNRHHPHLDCLCGWSSEHDTFQQPKESWSDIFKHTAATNGNIKRLQGLQTGSPMLPAQMLWLLQGFCHHGHVVSAEIEVKFPFEIWHKI